MKYIYPLFFFCFSCAFGSESEEEILFLHRIASFWSEGEYKIAKTQIQEFFSKYPESHYKDFLLTALGNLYLKEKNYPLALETYANISSLDVKERNFLNEAECLYQLQWYSNLAEKCEAFLKHENLSQEDISQATYYFAVSLYQQSLNAPKNSEALIHLAEKAFPLFETLSKTDLYETIAPAFAHVSSCLQNFSKAAEIYEDLAKRQPEEEEIWTYEQALLQAEYNQETAIKTFDDILQKGGKKAKDAAFNILALLFESAKYDEIIEKKENLLSCISSEQIPNARLFIGRSLIAKGKYKEAAEELQQYLNDTLPSDTFHATLLLLLNASFQAKDLLCFHQTLEKLKQNYPHDSELAKANLCLAILLKKEGNIELARQKLEEEIKSPITASLKAESLIELIQLEYDAQNFENTRKTALSFIQEFPSHPLAADVSDYLLFASQKIATPEELQKDIHLMLSLDISLEKKTQLTLLQAETLFDLQKYDEAIHILEPFVSETKNADGYAILGLCYKESKKDLTKFCEYTEEALQNKLYLFDLGALHASLYNAYLELSSQNHEFTSKANEHLMLAFENKAPLSEENQIYLANTLFNECIQNPSLATQSKSISLFEAIISTHPTSDAFIKLAKLYLLSNRPQDAVDLLAKSRNTPSSQEESHTISFLLAESYELLEEPEKAFNELQKISEDRAFLKTQLGASSVLKSSHLLVNQWKKTHFPTPDDPAFIHLLCQLKDVVLQKNIHNEPFHLEAALEYIDLQTHFHPEKAESLLLQMKESFENTQDILSKDYHDIKNKIEEKNHIYQSYMQFIDAEILFCKSIQAPIEEQKELQAKAKKILLRIKDEKNAHELSMRVQKELSRYETIDP